MYKCIVFSNVWRGEARETLTADVGAASPNISLGLSPPDLASETPAVRRTVESSGAPHAGRLGGGGVGWGGKEVQM